MEIIHRVGFNRNSVEEELPYEKELVVKELGHAAIFDIAESNHRWPEVQAWMQRVNASDITTTVFSAEEVADARWLVLGSSWLWSYPQPKKCFGYLRTTYDSSKYCDRCGAGAEQKEDFRVVGEPAWGLRGILQLNWLPGVLFVKPEIWRAIFEPNEIKARPVYDSKGRRLKTILQLVVDSQARLVMDDADGEKCVQCGVVKHPPVVKGFVPPLEEIPKTHVVNTQQIFGSGQRAFRRVVVSQSIASAIGKLGVKGASLLPLARGESH